MTVTPPLVCVDTVGTGGQYYTVSFREITDAAVKRRNLRWTNEREIPRIKEEANPLPRKIRQRNLSKLLFGIVLLPIVPLNFKMRRWLTYSNAHDLSHTDDDSPRDDQSLNDFIVHTVIRRRC